MLTRLRVKGFKNLIDVDVRFGPFTCIAGPNGVGKSNLFDAIIFMRELADKPFLEAARAVRGGEDDPANLFTAGMREMTLSAALIIPQEGVDELGQRARASSSFVEYILKFRLSSDDKHTGHNKIELFHESLTYVKKGEAKERLGFTHSRKWRDSVISSQRATPFISTDPQSNLVKLHQNRPPGPGQKSSGGRTWEFLLNSLPRTVLSSARNAQENRTAVLVRREMQNWRLLQLEPSAMRLPDEFRAPDRLDRNGAHLPAALYRLITSPPPDGNDPDEYAGALLQRLSNRVAELVKGVRKIRVERDEERKLFKLMMKEASGIELSASSLSDGTLRFLALAVLEADPLELGVICLEEPENGVHPARREAMLRLLQDIAVDPDEPVGSDNPLRQVIVNSHSPTVVKLVPAEALLFAESVPTPVPKESKTPVSALVFRCVENTWRTRGTSPDQIIALGDMLAYLNPVKAQTADEHLDKKQAAESRRQRRVTDYLHERLEQLKIPLDELT